MNLPDIKMGSEMLPTLEHFMLTPLVTWVKTFGYIGEKDGSVLSEYTELVDGYHLNKIIGEIEPKATSPRVKKADNEPSQRIQNLAVLVQHVKAYYQETLQQLIMMPLPNALVLGKNPFCEQSVEEMKKLLLLLLGCAVQCDRKEEYIEKIQMLDFGTKAAIASHIQEVTDSQDSVFDLHWLEVSDLCPEDLDTLSRSMAVHLRRLVDQRDQQLETIMELLQERESGYLTPTRTPSPGDPGGLHLPGFQQHLTVELADTKAKSRRLRQELEEKSEQLLDCRQELESMEAELRRVQQENMQLLTDARAARTYRDELDALREKALRADKLESEVGRYRDRLHNLEFYKAKVEELKEDNQVLLETKAMLEEQLEGSRARSDKLHQLEKHSLQLQAKIHDMEEERASDRRRIEELLEENLFLEMAQKRSMEESQHLGWELEQLSKSSEGPEGSVPKSLDEEVAERACSRLLRLERENQTLRRTVEELRGTREPSEEHKRDISHKVRMLMEENELLNRSISSLNQIEETSTEGSAEEDLRKSPPESRDVSDNNDNKRLVEQEELVEAEREAALREISEEVQHYLEERRNLQEKGDPSKFEEEEEERGSPGGLKRRSPELSLDNPEPSPLKPLSEASPLGQSPSISPARSSSSTNICRRSDSRSCCTTRDAENRRLASALENSARRLRRLEGELRELEAENQTLQRALEELRLAGRRLERLEANGQALEQEAAQLERDKGRLEKENRRLRQRAEVQEASLDASALRQASLEKENRTLGKELEALREAGARVKELEMESREMLKQTAIDQRTLSTLREELVSEKLKCQQRDSEVKRLTQEMERMGYKQQQQQQDPLSADLLHVDNSRYKQLESELESSLKRCVEIKEEKMAALEARLQESSSLNHQLRQELRSVKLSYEALLQRQEEEECAGVGGRGSGSAQGEGSVREWQRESQEVTRELLRVKDRLIDVERNNATLQAERQALQTQLLQLQAQTDGLRAQVLALQRQTASLQESNTTLQTQNAQLQVEKSTLNSQSAALLAENAQVQRQQFSAESERDGAVRDREDLRTVNELLLRDHERLAALHERQAAEYEALIMRHGGLKSQHRSLELDHHALEDRYNTLLQQKTHLEVLEKALREEQQQLQQERVTLRSTTSECQRLRDEKDWLNQTYQKLLRENEELQTEHKSMKSLLNASRLEQTRLETDLSKLREQHQQLDITSTKLNNQCELLTQLKKNMEEENRHLVDQIQTLMLQNRTLLEQTVESKDLFHVEQRQYIDKLNELRRQKEKLEEKIMDQYKFYDPSPPRRRGNWIALKMRKLIKSRSRERDRDHDQDQERGRDRIRSLTPTRSESCEGLPCHDNGSFVSSHGSAESAANSLDDNLSPKRSNTKNYAEDVARTSQGSNDERQSRGGLNSTQSESSGEFSLENEGWSSGSSPAQCAPSRRGSDCSHVPPAATSTPTQASAPPKPPRDGAALESYASGRGVWRSSSGRATGPRGVLSQTQTQTFRTVAISIEGSRAAGASPPPPEVQVQDKPSGAAGCLDCFSAPLRREAQGEGQGGQSRGGRGQGRVARAFSTLPRASSVISTSEGSIRRASFHSMMSKSATPSPHKPTTDKNLNLTTNLTANPTSVLGEPGGESSAAPPRAEAPEGSLEPPLFGYPFTLDSVFTNTIFSESSLVSSGGNSQTFLCLNPALVHNISGPPLTGPLPFEEAQELVDLHMEQDEAQEGEAGQGPQDCSTSEDYMTVTEKSASLAPDNKHSLMA
ncbi:girdin isoform X2 [Clupea harengus]|uniref:Girdin isoform X2 n=1 Tax=Clupea harengus TaxID=7950 RepID=A0A6P8F217_CLUHA|nr:girdin isoform X2 [Clupea harengus]